MKNSVVKITNVMQAVTQLLGAITTLTVAIIAIYGLFESKEEE